MASGTKQTMKGATNPYWSAAFWATVPANTATMPFPSVACDYVEYKDWKNSILTFPNVSLSRLGWNPRELCSLTIHASNTENSSEVDTPPKNRPIKRIQKLLNTFVTPNLADQNIKLSKGSKNFTRYEIENSKGNTHEFSPVSSKIRVKKYLIKCW